MYGLVSHIPHSNGNTYIRPGKYGNDIIIDNANNIKLGANKLCLNGVCITSDELKKLKVELPIIV
jgi:hypothetical protein